jgi:hypothetical protein|tara:strand:- start:2390 stop:2704 length:315 start_codon:yes stop_codon:yes gene_type:complete
MFILNKVKSKFGLDYPPYSLAVLTVTALHSLALISGIAAASLLLTYVLGIYFYASNVFPDGFSFNALPLNADLRGYSLYVTTYLLLSLIRYRTVKFLHKNKKTA